MLGERADHERAAVTSVGPVTPWGYEQMSEAERMLADLDCHSVSRIYVGQEHMSCAVCGRHPWEPTLLEERQMRTLCMLCDVATGKPEGTAWSLVRPR